jgi:photosystem II stability/assembly factor-like uncharacterized protein
MNYRPDRCTLALVLITVASIGCGEATSGDEWELDGPGDGEWQDLEGPPGAYHVHMGQIGQTHYFDVGHRDEEGKVVPRAYEPEDGWREATAMYRQVYRRGFIHPSRSSHQRPLLGAGGYHLLGSVGTASATEYVRSPDQGDSWEPVPTLPEIDQLYGHGTHRGDFYMYGSTGDEETPDALWRSRDGGASWEQVRDDVDANQIVIRPGELIVESLDGDHLEVSTDGAETWERYETDGCREAPVARTWFRQRDQSYFLDGTIRRFSPTEDCPAVSLEGFDEADRPLVSIASFDDGFLGLTRNGQFGTIDADLEKWRETSLPEVIRLQRHVMQHSKALLSLGANTATVLTNHGLLQTTDGRNWTIVEDGSSTPEFLFTHNGQIVVQTETGGNFRLDDNGEWHRFTAFDNLEYPGRIFARDGRLFRTTRPRNAIYEYRGDEPTLVVGNQNAEPASGIPAGFPKDLQFHDGRVFVAGRYDHGDPNLPASNRPDTSNGGVNTPNIHTADSLDDDLAWFGGSEAEDAESRLDVADMTLHDGGLWVVTRTAGVWRTDLDEADWQPRHRGLPTQENGSDALPVRQLVSLDADLYALARDTVYHRTADGWTSRTRPALDDGWNLESPVRGILDLLTYRGRLVLVAHDGLYTLDSETGDHDRFWQPDRSRISTARALSSGLYVGVAGHGLRRLERSH